MIKDPNDLYDDNTDPGQPPPKVSAADSYLKMRSSAPASMPHAGSSFKVEDVDKSDQSKLFGDTGIYDPAVSGQNISLEAGNRQSFGSKLGRRLTNLVPNMAAGIVDMVGNVGALLTEWGDQRDYHNGLNDLADSMKDPAGKMYHNSTDTWAIHDPAWWIDHVAGFAEMAGTFAIGGLGSARLLGGIAKLGAGVEDLSQASKLWQAGTQLANSSLMSYVMGAQGGANVYKETYDHQFTKLIGDGLSPDDAHAQASHIAAQSAATTAQLTTMLTIGMNVGAFAPYFKSQENVVNDIISKNIAGMEGESAGVIGKAVRGMDAADYADKLYHHASILSKVGEMGKIGTEMLAIHFAEKTGADLGNKGKTKGFLEQLGELSNVTDRVANSEGLLSFVMGAAMGGLQHYLSHDIIPSRKIEKINPDGTPLQQMSADGEPMVDDKGIPVIQKSLVTPRAYERDFTKRRFNNIRDAIAADFEAFDTAHKDLLDAVKNNKPLDAEEAKDRMFNTSKLYAVKAGLTEPWKKSFDKIGEMSPEEAMAAGYITDPKDDSYKSKASQASADMDHLSDLYNSLLKKYGGKGSTSEPLVDMVFGRMADLYETGKRLDRFEQDLTKQETEETRIARMFDPQNTAIAMQDYIRQANSAREVERQLVEDHKTLLGGNPKDVARLLSKYRAIGYGDGNIAEAIKDLDTKLRTKQQQLSDKVKLAEDAMLNSTNYNEWLQKHPDGKFDDFLKEANEKANIDAQNRYMRTQLEEARAAHEIATENMRDMTSEKSIKKFSRKANEWIDGLKKQADEDAKRKVAKLAEMTKDKTTLDRLQKIELNRIAESYRTERDSAYNNIDSNNTQIDKLKAELEKVKGSDILRKLGLKRQINELQTKNKQLAARAKKLDSLYNEYKVDTAPSTEPVDVEDVTGEQNGKVTEDADQFPTTGGLDKPAPIVVPPPAFTPEVITEPIELDINTPEQQANDYKELYTGIRSIAVQQSMNRIIDGMFDGTVGFSLDLLNKEIAAGAITQAKATNLLYKAQQYVKDVQDTYDLLNEAFETDNDPVQEPQVQVEGIDAPSTPVTENSVEPDVNDIPVNSAYHAGYKIVEAATTGATSTIAYDEGTRTDKKGNTVYYKVARPDGLNKALNEDILHPAKLLPGTALRYEVDTEYEGDKNITDSLSWDSDGNVSKEKERGADYLTPSGKVGEHPNNIGNVPIRVMDATTGKYLFHIRKLDWLEAKFPGTTDYRNIVDKIVMPDGEEIDNLSIQRDELMNLRSMIVDKFNKEGKPVEGKIAAEGKGTGRLILNSEVTKDATGTGMKSKVIPKLAIDRTNPENSMLPDPSLKLVISDEGGVLYEGRNHEFSGPLGFDPKKSNLNKGGVGAMVPAANGEHLYAPLTGTKIVDGDKPSAGLNSITRAIELFLLNDGTMPQIGAEIDNIESNTGFNIATPQGLKAFINQYYTYSQGFQDSVLMPGKVNEERFLFHINDDANSILDKTKMIKAGFTSRGDGAQYANLANGKLSPAFVEMLKQGLATRSRAVVYTDNSQGLKGINSSDTFRDATFIPDKGWKFNDYANYNEYVKSFSKTAVYGRNQLSDGTYVYTANPHLPMDFPAADLSGKFVMDENTKVEVVELPNINEDKTGAQMLDDLFNMSPKISTPTVVREMATGSDKSRPLDVKTLEEMYNFTPEAQRNGKTVREVYENLASRGISYLSDGYNPFSRCL